MEILNKIQRELISPKGQHNKFGNYKYRSCEDILEAVKPLLGEAVLTLTDDIVLIGDRYYVKATARLIFSVEQGNTDITVSAYARESLDKKGMDSAQITGAASSYARKYALNGLFCIDDTRDADSTNKPEKPDKKSSGLNKQGEKSQDIINQAFDEFVIKHVAVIENDDGLSEFSKVKFQEAIIKHFGKYPTNKASIPKILKEITPEEVVIKI